MSQFGNNLLRVELVGLRTWVHEDQTRIHLIDPQPPDTPVGLLAIFESRMVTGHALYLVCEEMEIRWNNERELVTHLELGKIYWGKGMYPSHTYIHRILSEDAIKELDELIAPFVIDLRI